MKISLGKEKGLLINKEVFIENNKNILILGNIGSGINESVFLFAEEAFKKSESLIVLIEDRSNVMLKAYYLYDSNAIYIDVSDENKDKIELSIKEALDNKKMIFINNKKFFNIREIIRKVCLETKSQTKIPFIMVYDYDTDIDSIDSLFFIENEQILNNGFYQVVLRRPLDNNKLLIKQNLPEHISHLIVMRTEFDVFDNNTIFQEVNKYNPGYSNIYSNALEKINKKHIKMHYKEI